MYMFSHLKDGQHSVLCVCRLNLNLDELRLEIMELMQYFARKLCVD
jgi:hypothetical protein